MDAADVLGIAIEAARWALLLVGVVFLYATVAAETRLPHWPVRMWDFPRGQIAVLCLVIAVLYPLAAAWEGWRWWDWIVPVVMLGCAVRQFMWIWPYVGPAAEDIHEATVELGDERTLRVVISNVLQQNEQHDLWRRVVNEEDPDLIACAEVDETWAAEIGRAFDETHPHKVVIPQDNMYGMAVWSRLPLEDVEEQRVVQDDVPSIHCNLRLRDNRPVRLHVLHPRPPAPQEGDSSSARDAELIVMARRIEKARGDHDGEEEEGGDNALPTIVCGDMNDVAWSRTTRLFLKVSGLLDPRRGRGLLNSFHAEHWWFRVPLDHVFVSREFRLIDLRRLDYTGSDHFPVLIDLALEPEKQGDQPAHAPEGDDPEDASELVEQQADREANGQENGHVGDNPEAPEGKR